MTQTHLPRRLRDRSRSSSWPTWTLWTSPARSRVWTRRRLWYYSASQCLGDFCLLFVGLLVIFPVWSTRAVLSDACMPVYGRIGDHHLEDVHHCRDHAQRPHAPAMAVRMYAYMYVHSDLVLVTLSLSPSPSFFVARYLSRIKLRR